MVTAEASADDDPGSLENMTVADMREVLLDPAYATEEEWEAVEIAINEAGGVLAYSEDDLEISLERIPMEQSLDDSESLVAFPTKVTRGPCTGYPAVPHRRNDSPALNKSNVGFKPQISCTRNMAELSHVSVLC